MGALLSCQPRLQKVQPAAETVQRNQRWLGGWEKPRKCWLLLLWGERWAFVFLAVFSLALFSGFLTDTPPKKPFYLGIKQECNLSPGPLGPFMGPQACVVLSVYWVFRSSFVEVQLTSKKLLTLKILGAKLWRSCAP